MCCMLMLNQFLKSLDIYLTRSICIWIVDSFISFDIVDASYYYICDPFLARYLPK